MGTIEKQKEEFSRLCSQIEEIIENKKTVRERTMLELSKHILTILESDSYDLPRAYRLMSERADDCWNYELDPDDEAAKFFFYARIYQMTKLLDIRERTKKRRADIKRDLDWCFAYHDIFSMIREYPGLNNKQLSAKTGRTEARLSQVTPKMEETRYFIVQRSGVCKRYYLSGAGEMMLKAMDDRQKEEDYRKDLIRQIEGIIAGIFKGKVPNKYKKVAEKAENWSLDQLEELVCEAKQQSVDHPDVEIKEEKVIPIKPKLGHVPHVFDNDLSEECEEDPFSRRVTSLGAAN